MELEKKKERETLDLIEIKKAIDVLECSAMFSLPILSIY